MFRTLSFIVLAMLASGVLFSFKNKKTSANDKLGI